MDWQSKPYWVMGVVNITPDSFSDGGHFLQSDAALRHAEELIAEGASILDLGAESTRPNATPVTEQQELDRLMPVLERLKQLSDVPISIDTSKPAVMKEALRLGVDLLNDVRSFRVLGADKLVQLDKHKTSVCIMHMQGEPSTMQENPQYQDVVTDVMAFWQERINVLQLDAARILLDPGFGFGKGFTHNVALFKAIPTLAALGYPLLIGVSRKRMIGEITGQVNASERVAGSVAAAVEAVRLGAKVVRVHDVAQTVQALKVSRVLQGFGE